MIRLKLFLLGLSVFDESDKPETKCSLLHKKPLHSFGCVLSKGLVLTVLLCPSGFSFLFCFAHITQTNNTILSIYIMFIIVLMKEQDIITLLKKHVRDESTVFFPQLYESYKFDYINSVSYC